MPMSMRFLRAKAACPVFSHDRPRSRRSSHISARARRVIRRSQPWTISRQHCDAPIRRARPDVAMFGSAVSRCFAILFFGKCCAANAVEIEIGPGDDLRTAMQNLQPGDTLVMDGGTYLLSSYFELVLAGTVDAP